MATNVIDRSKKSSEFKNYSSTSLRLKDSNVLSLVHVFYVLVITMIGLVFIYLPSIKIYWRQTYHSEITLSSALSPNEEIVQGAITHQDDDNLTLSDTTNQHVDNLQQNQNTVDSKPLKHTAKVDEKLHHDAENNKDIAANTLEKHLPVAESDKIEKHNKHKNHTVETKVELSDKKEVISEQTKPLVPKPLALTLNDKVFFAGDSMMQGVAPYVKKMLFKKYKIESVDLSKQSTGLTYPSAFDWPKTITETLDGDTSIKLLVVFLGPNDPWDFPIKGQNKYAKFKSERWEQEYRLRIENILNTAMQHNVQVLWLAAPCMRKPKLNDGMIYLNSLYESEIQKANQHFLTTNDLLGCTYQEFTNFIETDKEKIKVRIDDGIHFTAKGQQILAKAIMKNINVEQSEDQNHD